MTIKESEPDIDLNASSTEPPIAHAIMIDENSASGNPLPESVGTTKTTTYTVPPPGGRTPGGGGGVPAPAPLGFLTRSSMTITCPHCAVTGNTRPQTHVDCITVLIVVILLLLFWPLFWLPFVVPCCKSTEQYCGSCHRKVGEIKPCS